MAFEGNTSPTHRDCPCSFPVSFVGQSGSDCSCEAHRRPDRTDETSERFARTQTTRSLLFVECPLHDQLWQPWFRNPYSKAASVHLQMWQGHPPWWSRRPCPLPSASWCYLARCQGRQAQPISPQFKRFLRHYKARYDWKASNTSRQLYSTLNLKFRRYQCCVGGHPPSLYLHPTLLPTVLCLVFIMAVDISLDLTGCYFRNFSHGFNRIPLI